MALFLNICPDFADSYGNCQVFLDVKVADLLEFNYVEPVGPISLDESNPYASLELLERYRNQTRQTRPPKLYASERGFLPSDWQPSFEGGSCKPKELVLGRRTLGCKEGKDRYRSFANSKALFEKEDYYV